MSVNLNHHAWEMDATFLNKGKGWSVKRIFGECIATKGVFICQVISLNFEWIHWSYWTELSEERNEFTGLMNRT
jgi:hypothetical protein